MKRLLLAGLLFHAAVAHGQQFLQTSPAAEQWVDSTFNKLSKKEKIAQLMVMRMSEIRGKEVVFFEKEVAKSLRKYNVGSICLFQGEARLQAEVINRLQAKARTPLMVSVDGETGLGMRFADVTRFPDQLTIGAVPDAELAYKVGQAIGEQCKRIGIHVNYAPVIDINNNPNNPVINFRSFGEDKYKVALLGTAIMKGMQDTGVMACAKHFPGHGDVAVDSHLDLPVINKTLAQLDSLELYPFKQLIKAGIGSAMVAHLYIPAIDTTRNQATSLSRKNVTDLLRNQLGFQGLTFTDALEMQGVAKFYPQGEAAVQSLIAGNDMLCLPGDIRTSIKAVRKAIRKDRLTWEEIDEKVRRVLLAKYNLQLRHVKPIDTEHLAEGLNERVLDLKQEVYTNAITLLRHTNSEVLPLQQGKKVAYVGIGLGEANNFAKQLQQEYGADTYFFNYKADSTAAVALLESLQGQYDAVVVGVHQYKKYPANNFGISAAAINLLQQLQQDEKTISFVFGNPYAIMNMSEARNLVACYEDDPLMHEVALQLLQGTTVAKGTLPVTVSDSFRFGSGITTTSYFPLVSPETVGLDGTKLSQIDTIATNAIRNGATPGCVVLVAKKGKVGFLKAYGHMSYDSTEVVSTNTVYDLASVTKITATTTAVMKLYEEGKLDLQKTLGDYLPWVAGTDKADLKLEDVLLHQAGLVAWIPFYRATIDPATGKPKPGYYSTKPTEQFSVRIAEDMYMRRDWTDSMKASILQSKLGPKGKYVYSDNDFIFLGKVVEEITGMGLDAYTRQALFEPLGMTTTMFTPREHLSLNAIAPTEDDKAFRQQHLRGDVHDGGAAMFGGVAGHAGLFSNAYDLAKLYQLLLNGGELNGVRLFQKETIDYFTAYHSEISRRGLGFDKPSKDNAASKSPYPTRSASSETFGHTGFTGICVWADPKEDLLYVFLSNRVNPVGDNPKLLEQNVRSDVHEAIYQSIIREEPVKKNMLQTSLGASTR
ncbi:beta-glucosidase-like glycosyl hydrolase [Pontibacter ummariensis]|uniref:beta-N-acetylhexosaminidase n=1 Tax=Pontibacter ummariensis TaxID=1610492 RepID=A0A239G0I4_9BACT|nr:glycoside hydrolase family 3 N-terminal domain-containing protein [Pontibacter ummariensis]PRY11697.1 beta-glucosidase-like glycosyl hydrolase [Pontibacter ummariensis]SNS62639.1 beta-glucosidase [Pontibacter ummariensis]